ncbi:MAG TPA: cellulose binding domain-containing protein [Candidatus Limnocylindrales bacterium]
MRLAEIAGVPVPALSDPKGGKDIAGQGHTAFLPSPAPGGTDANAARPATAMLPSRRRRLAMIVAAGAVPIMALLALAWAGKGPAAPAPAACQVTYQQIDSAASEFAAELTVFNKGTDALNGWDVRFGLPGDQNVVAAGDGTWRQEGRQVTLRPADGRATLDSGHSYRFALSGRYRQINAMPAAFAVSGTPCASVVLAPTAPSPPASPPANEQGKPDKDKGKGNGGPGKHND